MGTVYLAEHLRLHNQVAIKLLHAEISASPTAVQRFLTEAQAQSRIAHPGIALLFDFAQPTDAPSYLVMEYVAGESLRERLQRGPLAVPEAISVLTQAAATLAAAHAVGVVHRDLKPANLMLVPLHDGSNLVKVLDFGLARLILAASESDPSLGTTRDTVLMGTVRELLEIPSAAPEIRAAWGGQPLAGAPISAMTHASSFAARSPSRGRRDSGENPFAPRPCLLCSVGMLR